MFPINLQFKSLGFRKIIQLDGHGRIYFDA
jgi:hypothetical protein